MNFYLNEDQVMFQNMLRGFVSKEIEPYAKDWDVTEKFPHETIYKMAQLGLFGVHFPREFGGSGQGELSFVIAIEEISRGCAGLGAIYLATTGLAMYPMLLNGNKAQNSHYIPRVINGKMAAFALTESGAGSDIASLAANYIKKENHYILNGNKIFITNGAEADFFTVFATIDRSLGYRGISAFIVDRNTSGFSVGKLEKKMGMHPSSTAELILDHCEIPAKNLIGQEGTGFKIAMSAIDASRISVAAQAVGIAQAAFDVAVKYAKERVQFGTQLAHIQAIQWMVADMGTYIDAARLLTYKAAWLSDQDHTVHIKESAMAKLFSSEAAHKVCHKAQQIFGGYGYTKDFPLERYTRDQRITEIYEGTSEMQRWTIARQILGVK